MDIISKFEYQKTTTEGLDTLKITVNYIRSFQKRKLKIYKNEKKSQT